MFNITNLFVDLIFIFLVLILAIFIFIVVRVILTRSYYLKHRTNTLPKDIKHDQIVNRHLINPIVTEYKSYFKIYKLGKNYTTKTFLNYSFNEATVFIKQETNYDTFKNSH